MSSHSTPSIAGHSQPGRVAIIIPGHPDSTCAMTRWRTSNPGSRSLSKALAKKPIMATMDTLHPALEDMEMKAENNHPVGIMISVEDAADTLLADFFAEKEAGYDEWLFGKVGKTMERVASGKTGLHEHSDAMALMKGRLEARLRKSA